MATEPRRATIGSTIRFPIDLWERMENYKYAERTPFTRLVVEAVTEKLDRYDAGMATLDGKAK